MGDATQRYEHKRFVERFLESLSSAIGTNGGGRTTGVKRSLDQVRNNSGMSASLKVLNARMALGADDQAYLSTGLGLLWAGDPNPDDEHLLFPSSMGGASVPASTRQAFTGAIAARVDQQIAQAMAALQERLPALLHVLSVPEVGRYVLDELDATDMRSTQPTSLGVLISNMATTLDDYRAEGREKTPQERTADAWRDRLSQDDSEGHIEELIVACAVLVGLYMRSTSDRSVFSPMEVATRYTNAAVDVALMRDWSSMEGVMRAARAYRVQSTLGEPPVPENARGPATSDGPERTSLLQPREPPRRASGPVLQAGEGPQPVPLGAPVSAPAPANGAVGDARVAGTDDGPAEPQGAGVAVEAAAETEPMAVAAPPTRAPAKSGGGWMAGLLGPRAPPAPAEIGMHSEGEGGQISRGNNHDATHRIERTQEQKQDPNDYDTYMDTLGRVKDLVLEPLGVLGGMSMSLSASPLWNENLLPNPSGLDMTIRVRKTDLERLYSSTGTELRPSEAERVGYWDGANPRRADPNKARCTERTVVRALYQDALGPARKLPNEIKTGWYYQHGAQAPLPADKTQYKEFPPGATELYDNTTRGARVDGVMAPYEAYSDGNGRTNRFVSYALMRGLTADYGPNERNPNNRNMRYTRGQAMRSEDYGETAPRSLPPPRNERPTRVPRVLLNRWAGRDVNTGTLLTTLDKMIAMKEWASDGGEMEVALPLSNSIRLLDPDKQSMQNTLREVRWAPVAKRASGSVAYAPSYAPGARAASAAATYEHLIETLADTYQDTGPRTKVSEPLRASLRASLKLLQLPHLIQFDMEYKAANGSMPLVMNPDRSNGGENQQMAPLWNANGSSMLFRTLLPTSREMGRNVSEILPPAFAGVWPVTNLVPAWNPPKQDARRTVDLLTETRFGLGTNANSTAGALQELARLSTSTNPSDDSDARINAPDWGLSVPHLPIGITFSALDNTGQAATVNAGDRPGRFLESSLEVGHRIEQLQYPTWLTTDARVETLVRDCHRLAQELRELRIQRAALVLPDDPVEDEAIPSLVERERRGAIWEDALREMAISSDRLYNFLRSMSGTLHEDVNAVVEVEVSLALQPRACLLPNVTPNLCSAECDPLVRRTTPWRRPAARCASGGRRF